jgi:Concanavalin A-like lectin/glucanases superfamily
MMDAASEMAPELSCPNAMMCLKMALVHRYSFDGTGTAVTDTVGTAHGTVMNGTLSGNGDVVLTGTAPAASAPYVDLPNGIINQLTSATLEAWVTWTGGGGWQRLFDFGNSGGAENTQGSASTTFYLTPQAGGPNALLAAFKRADQTFDVETRAVSLQMVGLATGAPSHVAVVIDPAHTLMTLYRNGAPDGSVLFADSLSLLSDVNNWLGRSQYGSDPAFAGTLQEFRIYNAALPPDVILASFTAGPTATF